jgi:hypothetical protein
MYARFVPFSLKRDQIHLQTASSETDGDRNVLEEIATDSEGCCFMCNPETKYQSATWLGPKKPKAQKVIEQKLREKATGTAISNAQSTIHYWSEPQIQTVNGKCYKQVIKRLIALVHCVRPQIQGSGSP